MNELEQYIRDHAAAFDTEAPAAGHEARFLARLEAGDSPVKPANDGKSFRAFLESFRTFLESFRTAIRNLHPAPVLAFALAACLALVLIIRPGDPFRGVSNEPEAIYLAYMDRVADLYQALPLEDDALREITEEDEPLFAQLPDDISSRQRARILKAHYGELLSAARQLKKQ